MIHFPLTAMEWTVLLTVGIGLAGLGYEYRQRPVFSDPDHWTNNAAYAVMTMGRSIVYAVILLAVGARVAEILAGLFN